MLLVAYLYNLSKRQVEKEVREHLRASPQYEQGLRERYKIEGKFGESKKQHGLGRCRYLERVMHFAP